MCFGMFTDLYKLKCEHGFCNECILDYITDGINSGKTDIQCPECVHPIDISNLQGFVPDDLLILYDRLVKR